MKNYFKKTALWGICCTAFLFLSCSPFIDMPKTADMSFILNIDTLSSINRSVMSGRAIGQSLFMDITLTAAGKTETKTQPIIGSPTEIIFTFTNIPVGSPAEISAKLYEESTPPKTIATGKTTIRSIIAGSNPVSLHMTPVAASLDNIIIKAGSTVINLNENPNWSTNSDIFNVTIPFFTNNLEVTAVSSPDTSQTITYSFTPSTIPSREGQTISLQERPERLLVQVESAEQEARVYTIIINPSYYIVLPDYQRDPNASSTMVELSYRNAEENSNSLSTFTTETTSNGLYAYTDFSFDPSGNLFYCYSPDGTTSTIMRINATTKQESSVLGATTALITALSYDVGSSRLYFIEADKVYFLDFSKGNDNQTQEEITFPAGSSFTNLAVANETIYVSNATDREIRKYSIKDSTSELSGSITYPTAGIDVQSMQVTDMHIQDKTLYILARDTTDYASSGDYSSRGKLITVAPNTMKKIAEYGWAGDSVNHPLQEDLPNKFVGPTRFIALAPEKLIIADDGACGEAYSDFKQKNRIMTFDITLSKLTATDVDVEFFEKIDSSAW